MQMIIKQKVNGRMTRTPKGGGRRPRSDLGVKTRVGSRREAPNGRLRARRVIGTPILHLMRLERGGGSQEGRLEEPWQYGKTPGKEISGKRRQKRPGCAKLLDREEDSIQGPIIILIRGKGREDDFLQGGTEGTGGGRDAWR